MVIKFDKPITVTFALPENHRGELMRVENTSADLLHYVEGEALKPGQLRIFRSTGKRWRRCRIRELFARLFPQKTGN